MPMLPAPRTPIFWNLMLGSVRPPRHITSPLTPQSGPRRGGADLNLPGRRTQFGGEKCHRRTLEQTDDGQILFEFLLDHGNHLDGSEGRSARFKEVIVHPDSRPAQYLLPYVGERDFQRVARCDVHPVILMKRLLPEPVLLNGLC